MTNVIDITLEDLKDLVVKVAEHKECPVQNSAESTGKFEKSQSPTFLGYSDDGMAIYKLKFEL